MSPSDTPILRERLNELADAMGGRPFGDAGVKAWFIALKDCSMGDVVDALDEWLRTRVKVPTPADIRALAGGRLSARIERVALAEREQGSQAPLLSDLRPERADSPAYREFCRFFEAFKQRSTPDPKDWARRLRDAELAGEKLLPVQSRAWRIALGEGASTEAQAEAIVERRAIQSEGL